MPAFLFPSVLISLIYLKFFFSLNEMSSVVNNNLIPQLVLVTRYSHLQIQIFYTFVTYKHEFQQNYLNPPFPRSFDRLKNCGSLKGWKIPKSINQRRKCENSISIFLFFISIIFLYLVTCICFLVSLTFRQFSFVGCFFLYS